MSDRRNFLRTLGLGTLVATVAPIAAQAEAAQAEVKEQPKEEPKQQYYHFEKPISEYDRETLMRMMEYVNRTTK